MVRKPFAFKCTRRGRCCNWGGYACLYPNDIARLSKRMSLEPKEFIRRYTRHISVDYRAGPETIVIPYLTVKTEQGSCIFLDGKICSIHDEKPAYCKASPFVSEILLEDKGWRTFTEQCEGFGQGEIHTEFEMDAALKAQAELDMEYENELSKNSWDMGRLLGVDLPEPEFISDFVFGVGDGYGLSANIVKKT